MLKKTLTIILIFISIVAWTQTQEVYKDQVVLKNGTVLVGKLQDYRIGEELTLKLVNGNVIKIPDDQIRKIEMFTEGAKSIKSREYSFNENSFFHHIDCSIIPGASNNVSYDYYSSSSRPGLGLNYTFGYRYNNLLSLGVGTGIENFNYGLEELFIPLFFDYKMFFIKERISPFFSMKAGYSMIYSNYEFLDDKSGGIMLNPAIGLKIQGNDRLNFTLDLGLRYQKAGFMYHYEWSNVEVNRDVTFRRIILRFGVLF